MSISSTSDNQVTCDEMTMLVSFCLSTDQRLYSSNNNVLYVLIHVVQCWFFRKLACLPNMFILRSIPVITVNMLRQCQQFIQDCKSLEIAKITSSSQPKQIPKLNFRFDLISLLVWNILVFFPDCSCFFWKAVFLCLGPQLNSSAFFWNTLDSCEKHS